jgi:hypothetical protein
MKPKKSAARVIDFSRPEAGPALAGLRDFMRHGVPWHPREADPLSASLALALAIEILRALRDRGLLTEVSLDDLLDDAGRQFEAGKADQLVGQVRAKLKGRDDD